MGLDGVELVMAIEEEFKISILDSEAERSLTVGALVDIIYAKLRHNAADPCPSQHGFYVVRRQMMNQLGLKRSQIKPDTRLEDVIGVTNRKKVWLDLIKSFPGEKRFWPDLVRPKRMNRIVVAWIPRATCLCIILCLFSFSLTLAIMAGLLASVAALMIADFFTASFKTEFPDNCSRVQDLIKFVNTLDSKTWTKDEVFEKVKAITVETLGVKEARVTPDANFVDDLGLQ